MNLKPNSILFSPKRAFPKWLWDACLLALLIPVYLGHFPRKPSMRCGRSYSQPLFAPMAFWH